MGCEVGFAGPRGITPLMWAAKRGHIDTAKILLDHGADLLEKSNDADCNNQYNISKVGSCFYH
jgi:ankyrin repeat protein